MRGRAACFGDRIIIQNTPVMISVDRNQSDQVVPSGNTPQTLTPTIPTPTLRLTPTLYLTLNLTNPNPNPDHKDVQMPMRFPESEEAVGADNTCGELSKVGRAEDFATLKCLQNIMLNVWHRGVVPEEWKGDTIKVLFKKQDQHKCCNYRGAFR